MIQYNKQRFKTIFLHKSSVSTDSNKAIVLSDMHVLLSAAKNPTASNIRICDPKFIHINQKK